MVHSSLSVRLNPANPDHHLWNNNGTWWVHYTIHPTAFTKERVRLSLATRDVEEARRRRDALLRNQHRFSLRIEGVVDAALWLGWLFPRKQRKACTVPGSAKNRE